MLGFTARVITFYSSSTVKTIRLSHACRLIRQTHGENFSAVNEPLGKQWAFATKKRVSSTSSPTHLPSPPVSLRGGFSQPARGVVLGSVPSRAGMGMLRSPSHLYQDHLGSAHCWLQPNNAEQDETPPLWSFPANVKGHTGSQTGKGAVQGQEGFTVGAWKNPNGGYHTPST